MRKDKALDPNNDNPGLPRPSIDVAEKLAADLRNVLMSKIAASALSTTSTRPFLLLSLREPLLFRIVDLSEATLSLCRQDLALGAAILARCVLETTATLYALGERVTRVVEGRDTGEFDRDLPRMLFGGRTKAAPVEVIGVLSHIASMDKSFRGIRTTYDNLSEVAHPNFAGVSALYADGLTEKYTLHLGPQESLRSLISKVVIPGLCFCLAAAGSVSRRISVKLEEFCRIADKPEAAE